LDKKVTYKNFQNDIVLLRVVTTFSLVIYHSFAMFSGAWELPSKYIGSADVNAYKWIARFSFSILLESFTFISGYLFAYKNTRCIEFVKLIKNKVIRLIIPCLIFSCIYDVLFKKSQQFSVLAFYNIFCGVGHLWYLPMLFWCFVMGYYLFKLNPCIALVISLFLKFAGYFVTLPVRLDSAFNFLFFFAFGYYFSIYKIKIINIFCKKYFVALFFLIYITMFLTSCYLRDASIKIYLLYIFNIIYRCSGITSVYLLFNMLKKTDLPNMLYIIDKYSFGIYIFHQIILDYTYYHSIVPDKLSIVYLPFFGIIITGIVSFSATWLVKRTKIGAIIL
jgi:fucose 4-O-acetylase-like acetyltransferase